MKIGLKIEIEIEFEIEIEMEFEIEIDFCDRHLKDVRLGPNLPTNLKDQTCCEHLANNCESVANKSRNFRDVFPTPVVQQLLL